MASWGLARRSSRGRNQFGASLCFGVLSRAYGSGDGAPPPQLTHTDAVTGKASMVDVSGKIEDTGHTLRSATARGRVLLNSESAYRLVRDNVRNKKGDVLGVSQLAGIMGAKQTSNLIPLCHPLLLSHVDTVLTLDDGDGAVDIEATVKTVGPTGVEMEALTAVSVAALTVYDMCKAASKDIRISDVYLVEKVGGKSGHWRSDGA